MKRVTLSQLGQVLGAAKGTMIVTLVTRTEPKLLRKCRTTGEPTEAVYPLGVERLSYGRFMLGTDYQGNVRSRREREGHGQPDGFRAESLWAGRGQRIGAYLARHRDSRRLYLVARPASDEQGRPVKMRSAWRCVHDGRPIEGRELIALEDDFLADRPRKAIAKKQELAREIPYRTYDLTSIVALTFAGEAYRLEYDRYPFCLDVETDR